MIAAGKEMMKDQAGSSDPTNPCASLKASCTSKDLGVETVNGRSTEKWMLTLVLSGKTYTNYEWIDKRLSAPIKSQSEESTMEVRDIKEGAQPDNLFVIPPIIAKQLWQKWLTSRITRSPRRRGHFSKSAMVDVRWRATTRCSDNPALCSCLHFCAALTHMHISGGATIRSWRLGQLM
jgi:hypothetical protein